MMSILLLACINEVILAYSQVLFVVPEALYSLVFLVFKITGIATLLSFPVVINVLIRNYQEEPKVFIPIIVMVTIIALLPAGLFMYAGNYKSLLVLIAMLIVSLMIGGAGNKLVIPERFR